MVLGITLAGGFGIGSWLWGYNRENFKFDREMRQKNEFKILEFRNVQSQLWREDVRDIIALTEKKMDSYLIVSVLQLDACVGLFTEGRLEPGTPPWLLHLYMMTLGGAFMYLLMSVWFAMHASVVAQCSSVRLLTQFVRLPIPTWNDIEQMRTYASSYEQMHPAHWLRVPFTSSLAPGSGLAPPAKTLPKGYPTSSEPPRASELETTSAKGAMGSSWKSGWSSDSAAREQKPTLASHHADPWGLEAHGEHRQIYELTEEHPALRRHVLLARKAASQYQCYDAFARVSMTFGTNQFLSAIAYYSMGYVGVQDGAPWVAVGVAITMGCMAIAMISVDFSLTRCEQFCLQAPIVVALTSAIFATFADRTEEGAVDASIKTVILPNILSATYIANGFWLFAALRSCGIRSQDNGSRLPTKFRAILYLDVFGWLHNKQINDEGEDSTKNESQTQEMAQQSSSSTQLPKGAMAHGDVTSMRYRTSGPSGQIVEAPDDVFHPKTFVPPEAQSVDAADVNIVTGHEKIQPGMLAARVFTAATWMLILLWVVDLALPATMFHEALKQPLVANVFVQEMDPEEGDGSGATGMNAELAVDSSGMPQLVPIVGNPEGLPLLPGTYEPIRVTWPTHASFVPRAIGGDVEGKRLFVADDFSVYVGDILSKIVSPPAGTPWLSPQTEAAASLSSAAQALGASFTAKAKSMWHPGSQSQPAPAATEAEAAATGGALRGVGATIAGRRLEGGGPATETELSVTFHEASPCAAVQGQSLKDISVVCNRKYTSICRLMVLTKRGRNLVECPLPEAKAGGSAWETAAAQTSHEAWNVSQEWLHESKHEGVESLAVNPFCLHLGRKDGATTEEADFGLPEEAGCVVVGTSAGRIVQMRASLSDPSRLIPDRIMHQRAHPSGRGSLCVVGGRFLLTLWSKLSTISAFDTHDGSMVKEWRLPVHIQWVMLGSGGEGMYLIGVRGGHHVELYRFKMPAELERASARRKAS